MGLRVEIQDHQSTVIQTVYK